MDNEGFFSSSSEETASVSTLCDYQHNLMAVSTQTDASPVVIKSWIVQRKIPKPGIASKTVNSNFSSLYLDSSNLHVMETHSLGFNVGTQTLHSELYGRSKYEMTEIVASWRVLTILLPSLAYFILYFLDQLFDIIVSAQFVQDENTWWSTISLIFLIGPSLIISVYSYEQLTVPDISSIKPVKKNMGRILCIFQLTPYLLLGRNLWWCIKAWSWSNHREEKLRIQSHELWEKAAMENDSTTVKLIQSLLESVPQLSLQSYVLLHKLSKHGSQEPGPTNALWISVIINLISASSGLASSQSQGMFERLAGSIAIFITLGSRVMVCGGIGTFHPWLWIMPVFASFFIGLITKVSESIELTISGHLLKLRKYILEAFVMASVSPPFDATGLFCSSSYVLAAFIFFMDKPGSTVHICAPILAVCGQALWLLLGFCLLKKSAFGPPENISNLEDNFRC